MSHCTRAVTKQKDVESLRKALAKNHEHLLALIEPLKALVDDVEHVNRPEKLAPVRAIGTNLHVLGGRVAQQAVAYAVAGLLSEYHSYRANGDVWADAQTTLNHAWNGCGRWLC